MQDSQIKFSSKSNGAAVESMFSNKLYTPLRYPGGKARFAPLIAGVMEGNGLHGGHYLELYAGGAGVALELLFHGVASHIHINDLDPAVNAFWRAVTEKPEELLRLLRDTPITMDQWLKWRAVMRGEQKADLVESGFSTLFMNRTNRSGILKGGVIGGKSQSGDYRLDARLKKDVISARIERIAQESSKISVYCEDALALLRRCRKFLPIKSLIYLDPPYYVKGRGLYRNYYTHDDHVAIAKYVRAKSFTRSWIVSYDDVGPIREMYDGAMTARYGLHYTAQERYTGGEVMFFSDRLKVSRLELPSGAYAA